MSNLAEHLSIAVGQEDIFWKGSSIMIWYSKCGSGLTFQNFNLAELLTIALSEEITPDAYEKGVAF